MKEREQIFTDIQGHEWYVGPVYKRGQTEYRMLASVEHDDEGRRLWRKMSESDFDRETKMINELNEGTR